MSMVYFWSFMIWEMKLVLYFLCKNYLKQLFLHFFRVNKFHWRKQFVYFLAIIQLIVAVLTVAFGIAVVLHGEDARNFDNAMEIGIVGIVGGVIISVAGTLGIVSYKDHKNQSKNAFHMAFSVIACCVSIVGIHFSAPILR